MKEEIKQEKVQHFGVRNTVCFKILPRTSGKRRWIYAFPKGIITKWNLVLGLYLVCQVHFLMTITAIYQESNSES